jgi:hypothetical protein
MTEKETPNESNESSEEIPAAKLDLSRYRTSGLVGNVVELISVPHALRRVIVVTLYLSTAVCAAIGMIFAQATLSGVGWLALCAYSLIAGFGLGILLGVLRVLSRALASIEELLKITLNITENAADDYAKLQSGAIHIPSAGELVEQVYEEVLLPTIEEAVAEAFGFLGRPILWLYRRSVGAAVRYVIKKMARFTMTQKQAVATVEETKQHIGTLAKYPEYIRDYTKQAAALVHRVSRKIRFFATLPLYIAFFVCLFMAFVPIVVLRFFATGEPSE